MSSTSLKTILDEFGEKLSVHYAQQTQAKIESFFAHLTGKYELVGMNEDLLRSEWQHFSPPFADKPVSIQRTPLAAINSHQPSQQVCTDVCQYLFTRGQNKGKTCGQKALNGGLCKAHSKIKSAVPVAKREEQKPVIQSLVEKMKDLKLVKTSLGNMVHIGTGFIIDPATHQALGRESQTSGILDETSILDLTSEDIDLCKQLNIAYKIPKILRQQNGLSQDQTIREHYPEEFKEGDDEDQKANDKSVIGPKDALAESEEEQEAISDNGD